MRVVGSWFGTTCYARFESVYVRKGRIGGRGREGEAICERDSGVRAKHTGGI